MPYYKNNLALTLLAAALPATAQAQNSASDFMLEEIVVTAEKREASLQDTAIAVTAMDAGMLERSNVEDTLDLQFAVPNLMVGSNRNLTLRGVGTSVLGGGADPAVSTSFNSMPIAPSGEIYDLERVEVLRGPQGTLFGRNTTGGVINYISAKPSEEFSLDLTAQVANFGSVRTKGALNLPITDSIFQRFAFNTVNRDGYTHNEFTGNDVDGRDEFSIRSTTRFEFGDGADATLTLQYYNEESSRLDTMKIACKPDNTYGCAADTTDEIGYPADFSAGVSNVVLFPLGILKPNRYGAHPNPNDYRKVSMDTDPTLDREESFAALEINIDLTDDLSLTSATSFVKVKNDQLRDFDLAAAPNAYNDTFFSPGGQLTYLYDGELQTRDDYAPTQRNIRNSDDFSQEFRIASSYDGDFNFLAGIAYTKSDYHFWGGTWSPDLTNSVLGFGGFTNEVDFKSESLAVFGETYYNITDSLTLTTGLRHTKDKKRSEAGVNSIGEVTNFNEADATWEEVTGKINLNWQAELPFTDETILYGTLSRGYKGGGLNPGNPSIPDFDPEYVDSIEFGTKNQLLDHRVQINAAAFFYDYTNFQVGGLIEGTGVNFNIDEVEVKGLELETVFLITENLMLNANASFLDTEIISSEALPNTSRGYVVDPATGAPIRGEFGEIQFAREDVAGNDLPYAPSSQFSLGLQYTHQLGDQMDVRYRVDYYWQSDYKSREFDNFEYESWDRVDLYVSLHDQSGKWDVEAFVKNAADDDSITGANADNYLVGLPRTLKLLDPRTYGVEFTYHWD
ncbi:TonB-dependent receptor [Pseudomaricurvus alkylphenolicus]|uniref:TonB-dependent receptor n=1 Tax=Pseudomaricurvus alkylphenolicus TaxID=1306991 RepID=UPI001422273F|nr:TonB-dependent receptor [Pseudomaricurvus alkylphenolicus]NIB43543.1 TonB-dependent receptor [Pseudomaricurvus alkylphenolicus]